MLLERPIVFFDLETTSADAKTAKIVEIALIKKKQLDSREYEAITLLVNPGIPIPADASNVHGIFDHDVADSMSFAQFCPTISQFIKGCDLGGFNIIKFDVPILFREMEEAGWTPPSLDDVKIFDMFTIFKRKEQRNLAAAVKLYLNEDIKNAHEARADVDATIRVFQKQLEIYDDIPLDRDGLAKYSNWDKEMFDVNGVFSKNENGEVCFNFGKHSGNPIKQEPSYLLWMLGQDFPEAVKKIIRQNM